MKPLPFVLLSSLIVINIAVAVGVAQAQTETVIKIRPPRTAVDLAFVVERDADDKVTKIHRFILWSNGDVSFPNIPYYAKLVFSCRDCPRPPAECPGDIDGDGIVGVTDLLIVQSSWGDCP